MVQLDRLFYTTGTTTGWFWTRPTQDHGSQQKHVLPSQGVQCCSVCQAGVQPPFMSTFYYLVWLLYNLSMFAENYAALRCINLWIS